MAVWKFDKEVAKGFPEHATSHIPNFHDVLWQCIALCIDCGKAGPIIDVGAATGETLVQLYAAGFNNLYRIDNSQPMLDECRLP